MLALKRRCAICHTSYSQGESFCPIDGGAVVADTGPITDDLVGTTIDGRYLVSRLVGRGGMGKVYEADHVGLGKRVAIKFVSDADADRDQRARFRQEARAASRIAHENVIQIFDVGADGQRDYLVMECVEGRDLDAVLRDGALAPSRAIAITQQILRGLHACHEAGIVHRDIKPSNIRLTNDQDFVKIMDFGISKSMHAHVAQTDTGAGRVIGTPEFMAPEQLVDGTVDHRADLFSVGATLFAMLAGAPPFAGFTRRIERRDEPPPSIEALRGGLPASLVAAIAKALDPDPAKRFPDALAFSDALGDGAAVSSARAEAATRKSVPGNRIETARTELATSGTARTELATSGTARTELATSGTARTELATSGTARTEVATSGTAPTSGPPRSELTETSSRRWVLPLACLAAAAIAATIAVLATRQPTQIIVAAPIDAAVALAQDAAVIAPADVAPIIAHADPAPADAALAPDAAVRRTPPPKKLADLPAGTVIPVENKGKPCICEFKDDKGSIDRACTVRRKEPRCECRKDSSNYLCPFPIFVVDAGVQRPDGAKSGTMFCVDRTRSECDPSTKDLPASCSARYRVAVHGASCSGYKSGMVGSDPQLDGTYSCSLCDSTLTNPKFYGKEGDQCIGFSRYTGDKVTGALHCFE